MIQIQQAAVPDITLIDLLMKGGVVMIPLLLLSLISVYLFVERLIYFRQALKARPALMSGIKKSLQEGDIKNALWVSSQDSSALGKIISTGLNYIGKPIKDIDMMLEASASIEIAEMEKNLGYLSIIAGIAPMLGFIGTISGVIHIFYNISVTDDISIATISGGLYEKMITSGCGLFVGMMAYTGYHVLHQKITRFSLQLQKEVLEFMNLILIAPK